MLRCPELLSQPGSWDLISNTLNSEDNQQLEQRSRISTMSRDGSCQGLQEMSDVRWQSFKCMRNHYDLHFTQSHSSPPNRPQHSANQSTNHPKRLSPLDSCNWSDYGCLDDVSCHVPRFWDKLQDMITMIRSPMPSAAVVALQAPALLGNMIRDNSDLRYDIWLYCQRNKMDIHRILCW